MLLNEHVYCVAITLKMTEQVEQWICIKFYVRLEHFSMEIIPVIQKAASMSNWWLAASLQNIPTHASHLVQNFLVKHQITQVTLPPYSWYLLPWNFWLFPKLKSPLKGKISDCWWDSRKYDGDQLIVIRRTVWGPKLLTLKGTEGSLYI